MKRNPDAGEEMVRERDAAEAARGEARRRLEDEEADEILRRWMAAGFGAHVADEAAVAAAGGRRHVVVDLGEGQPRLLDFGDRIEIDGPVTPEACRQMAIIAATRWDHRCRITGSWSVAVPNPDADLYYLACQRLDPPVVIVNYVPSAGAKAKAEVERARRTQASADGGLAAAARRFAAGETGTAPTPAVKAYVLSATDDERRTLAGAVGTAGAEAVRLAVRTGRALLAERAKRADRPVVEPEPSDESGGGQPMGITMDGGPR